MESGQPRRLLGDCESSGSGHGRVFWPARDAGDERGQTQSAKTLLAKHVGKAWTMTAGRTWRSMAGRDQGVGIVNAVQEKRGAQLSGECSADRQTESVPTWPHPRCSLEVVLDGWLTHWRWVARERARMDPPPPAPNGVYVGRHPLCVQRSHAADVVILFDCMPTNDREPDCRPLPDLYLCNSWPSTN
jgi:hypothetical protein